MSVSESPGGVVVSLELQRIPMSYDEWRALPDNPKAEWVDGTAIVSPPAAVRHMDASFRLTALLRQSLPELIIVQEVGVRVERNWIRVPDVTAMQSAPAGAMVEDSPMLVAEVLSPSTRSEDLLRKAPEYLVAGIGQYWVVDPDARRIEVYRNDGDAWGEEAVATAESPTATVGVADHGTVAISLGEVLPR